MADIFVKLKITKIIFVCKHTFYCMIWNLMLVTQINFNLIKSGEIRSCLKVLFKPKKPCIHFLKISVCVYTKNRLNLLAFKKENPWHIKFNKKAVSQYFPSYSPVFWYLCSYSSNVWPWQILVTDGEWATMAVHTDGRHSSTSLNLRRSPCNRVFDSSAQFTMHPRRRRILKKTHFTFIKKSKLISLL